MARHLHSGIGSCGWVQEPGPYILGITAECRTLFNAPSDALVVDLDRNFVLTSSPGSAQVLGHTGWRDISIQGLGHAVDKLGALALVQHIGRAGGEDKVGLYVPVVHARHVKELVQEPGPYILGITAECRTLS
jgi:hypothetical protein